MGHSRSPRCSGSSRLYAEGEIIQPVNSVPDSVCFITAGSVEMVVYAEDGRELSLDKLGVGDYIGVALTDTTLVSVPRDAMNSVVQHNARLARQIGDVIEMRRKAATDALAEAAAGVR